MCVFVCVCVCMCAYVCACVSVRVSYLCGCMCKKCVFTVLYFGYFAYLFHACVGTWLAYGLKILLFYQV